MKRPIDWHSPSTIDHYDRLLDSQSEDYKKAGWGSKESQYKRFDVLTRVGDLNGCSLLDVGCGPGTFSGFLRDKDIRCDYHGIDINPRMIEQARSRFPNEDFAVLNIMELKEPFRKYDYVFLSGALSLSQDRHRMYVEGMIERLFALSLQAAAFNILSIYADSYNHLEYYANPGFLLNFCLSLTRRVILRHDYMPHDFTVYMYHGD